MFAAVVVLNSGKRFVRLLLMGRSVIELDILELCPPDNGFLLLRFELPPRCEVVDVLLNDDVGASDHRGVFLGDENGVCDGRSDWIGRSINEAEQVSRVKIAESVGFVNDGDGISKEVKELRLELKAEVTALGADVEKQISGC